VDEVTAQKATLVTVTDQPPDGPATAAESTRYTERLFTPWWWYGAALVVAVLLGAEFAVAVSGWLTWVPFLVVLVVCVLAVWRFSSGRVQVGETHLSAGDRRLELTEIAAAIGLSRDELRRLVGRHGDPMAYTFIRSWVGPGVQLVRTPRSPDAAGDISDPTPYWVVSTRHPDRLLAALTAASVPVR
jgi:hypothetical protein